jgi:hypothetical protein
VTDAAPTLGGPEEPQIARDAFVAALRHCGVPADLLGRGWDAVAGDALGVLLYGSWARREGHGSSDLDLIVLSSSERPHRRELRISVSVYSPEQLRSASRTLFGAHLARDGVIVHDPYGVLAEIVMTLEPPDARELLARVRASAMALDVGATDLEKYLPGLVQLARYLLRTATYARALAQGEPCFSLVELAERFGQPELPVILSSHASIYPQPTAAVFGDLLARLADIVGPLPVNPYGSLQALIVALWATERDVATLATLALGADESLPYAELPKVIL